MSRLSFNLFGPFRVSLDGQAVRAFESDKARALLAYLALAKQAQRRERLAGLLWAEQPEERARQSLSQALYNLRGVLGDRPPTGSLGRILPTGGTPRQPFFLVDVANIQFNPASDAWLDVAAFEQLWAACLAHKHQQVESCAECMERLALAVGLYEGDFLADFYLDDCTAFEDWAAAQREQLRGQARRALGWLAEYHERRGETGPALAFARRQVELDPLAEATHRQVMRLLALSGQRSQALAQYQALRRRLAAELGVEPEPETQALFERLRSEATRPIRAATGQAQLADTAQPGWDLSLPAGLLHPVEMLVGCEAQLLAVQGYLSQGVCRLLTICGPGGSGKTRLALEAGRAVQYFFAHGACWVSLPEQGVQAEAAWAVARALGLRLPPGSQPGLAVVEALHSRRLLLVLDGCEAAPQAGALANQVLRGCPGVTILATSQVRLNVQGEQLFPLGGLELESEAGRLAASSLFEAGARRAWPDFELAEAMLPAIRRICQMVDGLPLGILLAAAWVELFTPAEIAAEMERSLDFLRAAWQDQPERQRSLRSAFEHSWGLLSQREQKIVQALAGGEQDFSRASAELRAQASAEELRQLAEKSLVLRRPDGQYHLPALVRRFATIMGHEAPLI